MLALSAGKWKGKRFTVNPSLDVRPTSMRARQGVFNVIEHNFGNLRNKTVADIFAGTGALGLEALSRGASFCLFVEKQAAIRQDLKKRLENLKGNGTVWGGDGCKLASAPAYKFDLVMLDPPYGKGMLSDSLLALQEKRWLQQDTLIIAELDASDSEPPHPHLDLIDDRRWGRNRFLFFRPRPYYPNLLS